MRLFGLSSYIQLEDERYPYAVSIDRALKLSGGRTYLNCSLNGFEDDQNLQELVDEVNGMANSEVVSRRKDEWWIARMLVKRLPHI